MSPGRRKLIASVKSSTLYLRAQTLLGQSAGAPPLDPDYRPPHSFRLSEYDSLKLYSGWFRLSYFNTLDKFRLSYFNTLDKFRLSYFNTLNKFRLSYFNTLDKFRLSYFNTLNKFRLSYFNTLNKFRLSIYDSLS